MSATVYKHEHVCSEGVCLVTEGGPCGNWWINKNAVGCSNVPLQNSSYHFVSGEFNLLCAWELVCNDIVCPIQVCLHYFLSFSSGGSKFSLANSNKIYGFVVKCDSVFGH